MNTEWDTVLGGQPVHVSRYDATLPEGEPAFLGETTDPTAPPRSVEERLAAALLKASEEDGRGFGYTAGAQAILRADPAIRAALSDEAAAVLAAVAAWDAEPEPDWDRNAQLHDAFVAYAALRADTHD